MESTAEVTTLRGAWRFFWAAASPRVMAVGLAAAVVLRLGAAFAGQGFTPWDPLAVVVVLVAAPFVEWVLHLLVLHRRPGTGSAPLFDLGAAHRQHHRVPTSPDWILLGGAFAGLSQVAMAILAVIVVGPLLWLGGAGWGQGIGPLLTAVVVALVALFHYEWAHLLFHTGYRPRTRYYRRLKTNHRLHHYRNEHHWLGVTGNTSDRVLGTYPASRSAVPLSPTARSLGPDPEAA